jgi:two-component system, OmpR family, response regulator
MRALGKGQSMTGASAHPVAVIVEDDADVRNLLAQVFEAAGFVAVAVESGTEGIAAVMQVQPLITSIDLGVPGLDGFELARRIRAAGVPTHIMMITAASEEADVVLGLSSGADEYLYKPLRLRELRARIEAVLRRAAHVPHPASITMPTPPAPSFAPLPTPHGRPVATAAAPATAAVAAPPTQYDDPVALPREYAPWNVGPVGIVLSPDTPGVLVHGDLIVDPARGLAQAGTELVRLDDVEVILLSALLESRRGTRSRADLTVVVHDRLSRGYLAEPVHLAVDQRMTALRVKLGDTGARARYIESIDPIGYRLAGT